MGSVRVRARVDSSVQRAATLPGASTALQILTAATPRWLSAATTRLARAVPAFAGADLEGLLSAFSSFADGGARDAFVQSTRGARNGWRCCPADRR
jgi:hypothetical protein